MNATDVSFVYIKLYLCIIIMLFMNQLDFYSVRYDALCNSEEINTHIFGEETRSNIRDISKKKYKLG